MYIYIFTYFMSLQTYVHIYLPPDRAIDIGIPLEPGILELGPVQLAVAQPAQPNRSVVCFVLGQHRWVKSNGPMWMDLAIFVGTNSD